MENWSRPRLRMTLRATSRGSWKPRFEPVLDAEFTATLCLYHGDIGRSAGLSPIARAKRRIEKKAHAFLIAARSTDVNARALLSLIVKNFGDVEAAINVEHVAPDHRGLALR